MPKRRPQPKPASRPSPTPRHAGHASSPVHNASEERISAFSPRPEPSQRRRSTYFEAVAVYERALDAIQRRDFRLAVDLLESILRVFTEEKELHERVRLYLNICERQAAPREATPQSVEERLYAATLSINGGRFDEAISHLRLVRDEDPDNDVALYMLASAHTQRGEHAEAIAHLERAIAINPENRALARRDPDLEALRQDDAFRLALEVPSGPRAERRRALKTRSAR
jgi:tetratricopeptide (TPR) repeat protein